MTIDLDQDTNTLARWANTLNKWTWPDDLPGKPENFDTFQGDAIAPIMKEIKQRIGDKEILRYHHLHNLKRSNEDFETWWQDTGEAFLATKVALTVGFDANGLPIAEARVIPHRRRYDQRKDRG